MTGSCICCAGHAGGGDGDAERLRDAGHGRVELHLRHRRLGVSAALTTRPRTADPESVARRAKYECLLFSWPPEHVAVAEPWPSPSRVVDGAVAL